MDVKPHSFTEQKNFLNIIVNDKKIRTRLSHSNSVYQQYEENEVEIEKIDTTIHEINHYLTLVNALKESDSNYFTQLQGACQTLYFDLLGQRIKQYLKETLHKTLQLVIDETLLYVPWELLFDGQKFLFEQFAIGRQIESKNEMLIHMHKGPETPTSPIQKSQIRMLILADPTEDLEEAYKEGELIFKAFSEEKTVLVEFHTSDAASINFLKKNLSHFDIVHYAGHVTYNSSQPEKSGWILSDGIFSITDIKNMGCGNLHMPALIFCNACQSGFIEKASPQDPSYYSHFLNEQLFPVFMSAGVKYYIGTFSLISDKYAKNIGLEFYRQLLQGGNSIGESLKKARKTFKEKLGTKSFSWTNYVLYGAPDCYIIQEKTRSPVMIYPPEPSSETGPDQPLDPALAQPADTAANPDPSSKKKKRKVFLNALICFLLLLALISFSYVIISKIGKRPPPSTIYQIRETTPPPSDPTEKLLLALDRKIKSGKIKTFFQQMFRAEDNWTTRPLTMAIFLDNSLFASHSQRDEHITINSGLRQDYERLTLEMTNLIKSNDEAITIVNRTYLEEILKEINLSFTEIANKKVDLIRISKLLGARLILFVKSIPGNKNSFVGIELIETETSSDIAGFTIPVPKEEEYIAAVDQTAKRIINELRKQYPLYPLKGKIKGVEKVTGKITLNLGKISGLQCGSIITVLDGKNVSNKIGQIKITEVKQNYSSAVVLEKIQALKKGDLVIAEAKNSL